MVLGCPRNFAAIGIKWVSNPPNSLQPNLLTIVARFHGHSFQQMKSTKQLKQQFVAK